MNGDNREFFELKQEFRDYRDRQLEANSDIRARLTSIEASIAALAPIISAHQERFHSLEDKTKANAKRIGRLEQGGIGTLLAIAGLFLSGLWRLLIPGGK